MNCEECSNNLDMSYIKRNDGITLCLDCATSKIYNNEDIFNIKNIVSLKRIWNYPPGYVVEFNDNINEKDIEYEIEKRGYEIVEKVQKVYIISEKEK